MKIHEAAQRDRHNHWDEVVERCQRNSALVSCAGTWTSRMEMMTMQWVRWEMCASQTSLASICESKIIMVFARLPTSMPLIASTWPTKTSWTCSVGGTLTGLRKISQSFSAHGHHCCLEGFVDGTCLSLFL
eukprot:1515519-Amphidinium_carterae.1